jgi:hypothetical protein
MGRRTPIIAILLVTGVLVASRGALAASGYFIGGHFGGPTYVTTGPYLVGNPYLVGGTFVGDRKKGGKTGGSSGPTATPAQKPAAPTKPPAKAPTAAPKKKGK